MRKAFVLLTILFVAAVASTGSLNGQDEIKFLKENRDRLQTICLITDVDEKASATNPKVVVDKPLVGTSGTTVKIIGTSIRVTPEQLRRLTADAVATFDKGFGTSSNRDAVIATMEWPFVRWPAAQSAPKFVPLGTESALIWQSSKEVDRKFERLGPLFQERGCEGVLILGVYHKAGIRSRGILAREP